jgi:hypothetical protein
MDAMPFTFTETSDLAGALCLGQSLHDEPPELIPKREAGTASSWRLRCSRPRRIDRAVSGKPVATFD